MPFQFCAFVFGKIIIHFIGGRIDFLANFFYLNYAFFGFKIRGKQNNSMFRIEKKAVKEIVA